MAQASYSFLDVAALDEVRERFAAGDALAILSADLDEVIWANGPGAALFGHADVETIFGAQAPLGAAAKRQIAALRGFPDIGRDRPLLVRVTLGMSSAALRFLASAVTLPDGEGAILLAQPAAEGRRDEALAMAVGGFAQAGHFVALIDKTGAVEAASAGFERLGLAAEAFAEFAGEADDGRRIVKRRLAGRRGPLPAGLARLTDERNLIVVIDENWSEADEAAEPPPGEPGSEAPPEEATGPAHEVWHLGSDNFSEEAEAGAIDAPETNPAEQAGENGLAATAEVQAQDVATAADAEPTAATEGEETAVGEPAQGESADIETSADGTPQDGIETEQADKVVADSGEILGDDAPATGEPSGVTDERRATGPVRFVWRTDAEGKFSQISPDFALAVGAAASDVAGRRFQDVANAFGLDPTGDIAGLLARRDTWSGRSVQWPVAGTNLKIPVDLAALPVYDRDRKFEGFRGFGVARAGDASVDPEGIGLVLATPPPEPAAEDNANAGIDVEPEPAPEAASAAEGTATSVAEAGTREAEKPESGQDAKTAASEPADPFRGEKPALSVTPAPDRRFSDKVIRLAEHRPPTQELGAAGSEKMLSTGERIAFQQIGERLKQDSREDHDKPDIPSAKAEAQGDARETTDPDEDAGDAGAVADLEALDGVTDSQAAAETGEAVREDTTAGAPPEEAAPPPRKGTRPGLSLLDFAEWGKDEPSPDETETSGTPDAAQVEKEEAAALDERLGTPPALLGDGVAHAADVEAIDATQQDDPVQAIADSGAGAAEGRIAPTDPDAVLIQPSPDGGEDWDQEFAGTDLEPVEPEVEEAIEAQEETQAARDAEAAQPAHAHQESGAGLSILEKLPVPVLVHSGDALHYANSEFFALTGYGSVEDLASAGGIGTLFADPYDDDADDEPRRKSDRHMRLKTRGGEEFPVEAFLQSVPWGSGKALILVLSRPREGLGGQSPLIAELEARVAEMRTIIDTATDGVVLISRGGDIRSISRPAEALFGIDSDEVAGKPFASLFAIESQKAAADYLNGLSDHGVASVLNDGREVIGREAQGRFIPLFMTIGKLPGDSGYCAVVRDITQWKRAEEELTQARATAERASSHKSEFLARVSHEIRTPLNAIIGFSELMLDEKFGPVANDRYRDYLRDINRSGNHVLDLVNDLLDISKIEAGQQDMSYEAVSLNEALAETVALMQPQANRERVIIRSSFASRLPDVVADLRSVRQIALNVLSNAVRYTQAGGQVIVSTAYESQGEVVMRVRDTGIGMTQAEIEQALKPFKQINSLKRTRGDGTGLGLPLTKAMVEANRAKFSIHSTPGEGTLVEVAFPPTRVLAD